MKKSLSFALLSAVLLSGASPLWAHLEGEELAKARVPFKKFVRTDLHTIHGIKEFRAQYKAAKHEGKAVKAPAPEELKAAKVTLPSKIDHRAWASIKDQGDLGSCTANALEEAVSGQVRQKLGAKLAKKVVPGSRLWLYYKERALEGNINEDAGAMIGTGVGVLHNVGLPDESLWPYDITKFAVKPSSKADRDAAKRKEVDSLFRSLDYIDSTKADAVTRMKTALAKGYRVVSGVAVYESFYNAGSDGGFLPMPNIAKESMLGGHAICAVGYDDTLTHNGQTGHFIFQNSWGANWGAKGFFYVPYAYMANGDLNWESWKIDDVRTVMSAPAPAKAEPKKPEHPAVAPAKPEVKPVPKKEEAKKKEKK